MANKEPKQWITVNGVHVPIFDGESKEDAVKRMISKVADKNADDKKKQIQKNKEQADSLNKAERIKELQKELENTKGILARGRIQRKIDMIQEDWKGTEEEYIAYRNSKYEKERAQKQKEYEERKQKEEALKKAAEQKKQQELEYELKTQPKHKVDQFKIIQETNPMNDDYHTGIRKPSDIKTWEEAIQDKDNFAWGDFSRKDAQRALEKGTITIYSSYPIKQGVFVSTSRAQSEQYAGGKGHKVYSTIVPLEDVAWINGDEGQFAQIKKKRGK